MNAPEAPDFVEREVRIAAEQAVVFEFFVDPVKMMQWKGIDATLDPRPGGVYRVNVTGQDIACGEYVEIVPHSWVVFTWGWEGEGHPVPPGSSTVEVTLVTDGDGTIVKLRHSGLSGENGAQHAEGWEHYLPRLALAAEGSDPGPDPWIRAPADPSAKA